MIRILLLCAFLFGTISCKQPSTPEPVPQLSPTPVIKERISLYWEDTTEPHPERKEWTDALVKSIRSNIETYDKAKDIGEFCPNYHSLNEDQKIKALGELWVAITFYESTFNPKVFARECRKTKCVYRGGCQYHPEFGYCMKGGHKLDGGIVISRGLEQISLESAQGAGCSEMKVPNDLHDPIKNLRCADHIMSKQINRAGLITAKLNYWAVVMSGGGNSRIPEIKARVLKNAPMCAKKVVGNDRGLPVKPPIKI